ncbi:MAG: acyl-CoA thioesterase [Deltaproteobacteria bacterium]|nr:acyl-CoA thioesterase [Deltaproteobacteria bacterium]
MQAIPASNSTAEFTHLVLPPDINAIGSIFGGRIMEWIDIAAAIVATRHCRKVAVTASMDALHFISPVKLGDIVIIKASVDYVHNTSMEIGVRVESEEPTTGIRKHTASSYLTFVALDENGKPTPVPELILENEEQKKLFEEGRERREERLKWKARHPQT